jgi:tetratricopeptide (TPR) repeat protein
MSFRFWRRVRLAPGITLNLSKTGMSMSFGPRGAKYTIGSRGRRATVGIPGTGLFYTKKLGGGVGNGRASASNHLQETLNPGFFKRLMKPAHDRDFIDGLKAFTEGKTSRAYDLLSRHPEQPDSAFLAGIIALTRKQWADAVRLLQAALKKPGQLGKQAAKYGIKPSIQITVAEHVETNLTISMLSAQLALVELYQTTKEYQKAADLVLALRKSYPDDVVIKLSLAELLLTTEPDNREFAQLINEMAGGLDNASVVHTALLLYQAKALRLLGLHDAARNILTAALRRKKDRPEELLREIRYTRALVYEDLGQAKRARNELESIYAEDPGFEDVAKRLGLK